MVALQTLRLPNEPTFERLIQLTGNASHTIVHDPSRGVNANSSKLLADVQEARESLYQNLDDTLFDGHGLIKEDTPWICVIAPGSYEFVVASFAILALGGAIVALRE
jgi:malonyl-CoA/methylmalonyl-CoA synthetase